MEYLNTLYNNISSPTGLAGEKQFFRQVKQRNPSITLGDVKAFLQQRDAHTLHRVTLKRFPRRKIIASGPGIIASADIADMTWLHKQNNGYKYFLLVIDIFSRYAQVALLKKKNSQCVKQALKSILETPHFKKVTRLHVDRGGEFYNRILQQYLKSRNIQLYSTSSYEIKAAIAERAIQTVKRKIYKYLTHYNTLQYVKALPSIIQAYNKTPHQGLGLKTPTQVHLLHDRHAIQQQFYEMYKKATTPIPMTSYQLPLNASVRIASKESYSKFRRGFHIQNTQEIFRIRRVDTSQYPPIYYLQDLAGDPIEGIFYRPELVPTQVPTQFPIKVLKKKKVGRIWQAYVQWIGYPPSFNTWLPLREIQRL